MHTLHDILAFHLQQKSLPWRRPGREKHRGEYCSIQVPPALLTCGCPMVDTICRDEVWEVNPYYELLPRTSTFVRVWRNGTLHGSCVHEDCGKTVASIAGLLAQQTALHKPVAEGSERQGVRYVPCSCGRVHPATRDKGGRWIVRDTGWY